MKRNYWPLFFIGIFSFTFAMIVWTIMSAVKVPVNEDEAFLTRYHSLDKDFNKVIESNNLFSTKYDFALKVNGKEFPLVMNDIFASQRVLEKKSTHKDILNIGKNLITLTVKDKNTNELKDVKIELRVTRATNHSNTMDFFNDSFKNNDNTYSVNFDLPLKGNWNITGNFQVGEDKGYFYIKTNAI